MSKTNLIRDCFNEYTGKNMEVLERLYDDEIHFQDPITDIRGMAELKKYYAHAYSRVKQIRFDFHRMYEAGDTVTAEWNMTLAVKGLNGGNAFTVHGVSVLTFSSKSNKVARHRDYLDIGEMVYERLPLFGGLIKALKGRLG